MLAAVLAASAAVSAAGPAPFTAERSAEEVRALVAARGAVWCATPGEVLVYRAGRLERRIGLGEGLRGEIKDLVRSGADVLARAGSGVFRLPRAAGERAEPAASVPEALDAGIGPVRRMYWHGITLYAAGAEGIAWLDGGMWHNGERRGLPRSLWVNSFFSHRGTLLAGTLEGLWSRIGEVWEPVTPSTPMPDVRAGVTFRGELWVSTGSRLYVSQDGASFRPQSPPPGRCVALTVEGTGAEERLWAGTSDRGLFLREGDAWRSMTAPGPPPGNLTALAGEGERLWIGAFRGRMGVRGPEGYRSIPSPAKPGEGVLQVVSAEGEVWARTSDGALWLQAGEGWKRQTKPLPWANTVSYTDGRLCAGGLGAAWVREGGAWKRLQPPKLGKSPVTSFLRVGGRWWVGTQRGVHRETAPGQWALHTLGTGLRDPWVTSLAAWRGQVWVGTFAGGISRYTAGKWTPYPGAAGKLDRVNALAAGRRLWCATPEGLAAFDGAKWEHFGPEQGLPAPAVNAVVVRAGRLYAATEEGLAVGAD